MTFPSPPGSPAPPQPSRPPGQPGGAPPPSPSPLGNGAGLLLLVLLTAGMWLWRSSSEATAGRVIDYSEFYAWAEQGKVESVTLRGQRVVGKLVPTDQTEEAKNDAFETIRPEEDQDLLPLLRKHDVKIRVASAERPFAVQLVLTLLPWVLIIGVWVFLSRRLSSMGPGGPLGGMLKGKGRKFERNKAVDVTFDDVAGLKSAKQDLQEIVQFLKEPERFNKLGSRVPRGVLLVGPPGTGKTLLARAVAGESGVAFFSISASEFIEMFVGVGAARVRELFAEARKSQPAIVFIDEIDAVGRSRGAGLGGGHDEREQTLNQLLSEMDGFAREALVVVMAATNRPDVLDPALLRPGRFDRRVIVDRPELAARRAILGVHTKKKPLGTSVVLDRLAEMTPGFSGADLANLVNEAALAATRRGGDAIEAGDFTSAYDKIVLGDPREAKLDVDEKYRVAVHETGHALVAEFSEHADTLHRVTIIPRGMALGVTQQTPAAERHIMTQPQLEARLRVLMGGYAAEREFLGSISTGAENDLKQATELASKMVAHYGMSQQLGPVYYEHGAEHPFLGQRIATDGGASDATVSKIESEARELLAHALEQAKGLLTQHKEQAQALITLLLKVETAERDDLDAVWHGDRAEARAVV